MTLLQLYRNRQSQYLTKQTFCHSYQLHSFESVCQLCGLGYPSPVGVSWTLCTCNVWAIYNALTSCDSQSGSSSVIEVYVTTSYIIIFLFGKQILYSFQNVETVSNFWIKFCTISELQFSNFPGCLFLKKRKSGTVCVYAPTPQSQYVGQLRVSYFVKSIFTLAERRTLIRAYWNSK